jgi:hypothetical protein
MNRSRLRPALRRAARHAFFVFCLAGAGGVGAQGLAAITQQEAASGLRQALEQGAATAVSLLGRPDGFLGNPQVRIPLPPAVQKVEGMMRMVGLGAQADELVTTMNRAAEMAVVEARPLLVDAVRRMSVQDAKGILAGGPGSATDYFRRTTSGALTERFLPIVKQATARVQLAETYNGIAGAAANFGVIRAEDANLDRYVTQKALDGLFHMVAEQENAIRANPVGASTSILRKVFGAIGR